MNIYPDLSNLLTLKMEVMKLDDEAIIPKKGSDEAAGYDLYSFEDNEILPKERKLISTKIAMAIPSGWYGRVASRSSLACKKNIDVGAGVIDSDYRGEIKVLLINNGNEKFIVEKKSRIAQLIITKYSSPEIIQVKKLNNTKRGEGGFGSTGK